MSKPILHRVPLNSESRRQRELDRIAGTAESKTVSIPLGKMVPLLIDAVQADRAWLKDFAEDTVTIDSDLFEVLLASGEVNRRAA